MRRARDDRLLPLSGGSATCPVAPTAGIIDPVILASTGCKSGSPSLRSGLVRGSTGYLMLTRDEVIWGFRYCLGRDPESESVVEGHRNFNDWKELRNALLRCPEFVNGDFA